MYFTCSSHYYTEKPMKMTFFACSARGDLLWCREYRLDQGAQGIGGHLRAYLTLSNRRIVHRIDVGTIKATSFVGQFGTECPYQTSDLLRDSYGREFSGPSSLASLG